MDKEVSAQIEIKVGFYDVDSMNVVWHGNYVKFLEDARCALLDKFGYDYTIMREEGYAWPIVSLKVKYIRPCFFKQLIKVKATLIEFENCLKVKYLITDAVSGNRLSQAETMQMAVNLKTGKSIFSSPSGFVDKVKSILNGKNL